MSNIDIMFEQLKGLLTEGVQRGFITKAEAITILDRGSHGEATPYFRELMATKGVKLDE